MSQIDPKKMNEPIFATQGGGLVREVKTPTGYEYFFVEAPPEGLGLHIGDRMPAEWSIVPANGAARQAVFGGLDSEELDDDSFDSFDVSGDLDD